jgi:hypothetical protein
MLTYDEYFIDNEDVKEDDNEDKRFDFNRMQEDKEELQNERELRRC